MKTNNTDMILIIIDIIDMSRHSKNNTAHSVFTYNEKKMLKSYGTQVERLGTDSFK